METCWEPGPLRPQLAATEVDVWRAVVRDCRVTESVRHPRTTLIVGFSDAVSDAEEALSEADAAAAAAKAESDRWGGADKPPAEVPERCMPSTR